MIEQYIWKYLLSVYDKDKNINNQSKRLLIVVLKQLVIIVLETYLIGQLNKCV